MWQGLLGACLLPGETDNNKSAIEYIVYQMAVKSMENSKGKGGKLHF